jgi:vacuolar-type H+-ATPase subunit D/Vma8
LKETVEILKRVKKLMKSKSPEAITQLKILNYFINSNKAPNDIEAELNEMYEVIFFQTDQGDQKIYSSFKSQDIKAVSDILAWILEIPKATHRQNKEYLNTII